MQKPPEIQVARRVRAQRTALKLTQEEPAAELEKIAREPGTLEALRLAHARALERFWRQHSAPEALTIDVDATLITTHSEKERAAGNYKGGFGFHPLQAYADKTREALGGVLRAGNAGSNTVDCVWVCGTTGSRSGCRVKVRGRWWGRAVRGGDRWAWLLCLRGRWVGVCSRQAACQAAAAAIWCLWSLRRLWVAVIRRHSESAADRPRRWNWLIRRLCLVCAKTGSTIAFRCR
jgi:hypothetical protein